MMRDTAGRINTPLRKEHRRRVSAQSGWRLALLAALVGVAIPGAAGAAAAPAHAAAPASSPVPLRRAPPAGVEDVILVFKTHFDIGYTDYASQVIDRYRTSMIDAALAVWRDGRNLPAEQQFVWTIPGWPLHKILEDWPGQTPARREDLQTAVAGGNIAVHALPFSVHTELLELEDLVQGMRYASDVARQAGKPLPTAAKMTDVPAHTWFLPTLLRGAGVDFLHLGCNPASTPPELPPLFWWQGPDGSRLLTMYSAAGYGTSLLPPAGWPHKTWLALVHTTDNHGPPRPDEVRGYLEQLRQALPRARIRIGQLSDFAASLRNEPLDLPVIRADMPDTWIHGPLSDPIGAKAARRVRPQLSMAGSLATLRNSWGSDAPYPAAALAEAGEQSLLYGEHTWGGALYWVTDYDPSRASLRYGGDWLTDRAAGKYARLERSWAEHRAYIERADAIAGPLLQAELNGLAAAVAAEGERIVVWNPLPWARGGAVRAAVDGGVTGLRDVASGQEVAVSTVAEAGVHYAEFTADTVPGLGYRTYRVLRQAAAVAPAGELRVDPALAALENAALRVELDPAQGAVTAITDKRTGRRIDTTTGGEGLGGFMYERFSQQQVDDFVRSYIKIDETWGAAEFGKLNLPAAVPYQRSLARGFALRYETTATAVSAVMTLLAGSSAALAAAGGASPGVTVTVTLRAGTAYVDLAVQLDGKPADLWPEAGWIRVPVGMAAGAGEGAPRFAVGRLGSIIDPARDIQPGANRHMLAVNPAFTITDAQGNGLGVAPLDSPVVSFGEPGLWRFSRSYVPEKAVAYVNLFNNQWSTNFPLWSEGSWSSRVRVWPVAGGGTADTLTVPGWEARLPLQAGVATGAAGRQAAQGIGTAVSCPGVLVTALQPAAHGGTLLRLWEQTGQDRTCQVRLPVGVRSMQPVDLREQVIGAEAPAAGEVTVTLRGFAPATWLLR